mmetsp:Transcript_44263/g.99587  ORF Transcript_44263/g.99587 Transcript_44263/m.99587 type:complete len:662 (+) Transcript_44263:83-2068(+)
MLWQGSITKPFQVAVEPAVCEAGGHDHEEDVSLRLRGQQESFRRRRLEARVAAKQAQREAEGEMVRFGLLAEDMTWTDAVQLQKVAVRKQRLKVEREAALREAVQRELATSEAQAREEQEILLAIASERANEELEVQAMQQEDDASRQMRDGLREEAERSCMQLEDETSRLSMELAKEADWSQQVLANKARIEQERSEAAQAQEAMQLEETMRDLKRQQVAEVHTEFAVLLMNRAVGAAVESQAQRRYEVWLTKDTGRMEAEMLSQEREAMVAEEVASQQRAQLDRVMAEEASWQDAVAKQKAAVLKQREADEHSQNDESMRMAVEDRLSHRLRQAEVEADASHAASRQERMFAAIIYTARVSARCALRAEAVHAYHAALVRAEEEAQCSESAAMLRQDEESANFRQYWKQDDEHRESACMKAEDERAVYLREAEQRQRRQAEREFALRKADHVRKQHEKDALRQHRLASEEQEAKRREAEVTRQRLESEERARAAQHRLLAEVEEQRAAMQAAEQRKAAKEAAHRQKLLAEEERNFDLLYSKNRSQVTAFRMEEAAASEHSDATTVRSLVPHAPSQPQSAYRRPKAAKPTGRPANDVIEGSSTSSQPGDATSALVPATTTSVWWHEGNPLDVAKLLGSVSAGSTTDQAALNSSATFFTES